LYYVGEDKEEWVDGRVDKDQGCVKTSQKLKWKDKEKKGWSRPRKSNKDIKVQTHQNL